MVSKQDQTHLDYLKTSSLLMGVMLGAVAALVMLLLIFAAGMPLVSGSIESNLTQWLPAHWYNTVIQQAQLMGFPLQRETAAYWYMARISGLLAYLLVWASTVWGLLVSTKIVKTYLPLALTVSVHEFLALLGLGFGLFHPLILLGDQYINFNLRHILVPFSAPFEPIWVGIGTLSLYGYLLVAASFYIRKRIGHKLWRALHYLTFLTYVMILIHSLAVGSESNLALTQIMYLGSAVSVLFLLFYRLLSR